MKTKILVLIILFLPLSISSFAQKSGKKYYITGQVVDMNNQPVSGCMVFVDNKNSNIITDNKGMYKVRVKADAAVVSIVTLSNGFLNEDINGRIVINFKLENAMSEEATVQQENPDNEAVDIGYGTVKKKHLVSGDNKIKGQNRYANYQDIYEMIKAECPGVLVSGNRIIIRGIATINSDTSPLVFVNGVEISPYDIQIPPSQVKSINILKGPDAAIYGSRGANGAILITLIGK